MNKNEPITKCPYCGCQVEETNLKHYVNGLIPVHINDGCSFCQPLPLTVRAAYTSDDHDWTEEIEAAWQQELYG